MNNQVSIVKCDTYRFEQIETAMEKLMFELGGMENFVKPGQRVMLKPNGAAPSSPDKHVTTHPLVIKAVIHQVKKAGGIPVIAESSAGIYPKITEQALKKCGFNQLAEEEGIEIINIDEYDKYLVSKPGEKIDGFYITSLVKEVDVIINIPKLKAHEAMFLSCAVKNFYGVIPLGQKPEGHKRYSFRNNFADLLLDIFDEVKPHLTIVDGIIGLGKAVTAGTPSEIGVLMAGDDSINVDAIAADLVGYKLKELPVFQQVKKRKYDKGKLDQIEVLGDKIDKKQIKFLKADVAILFRLPEFIVKPVFSSLMPDPIIEQSECTKCLKCEQSCPVKAIDVKNDYKIDLKECIHCFCCSEVCTQKAVKVKFGDHARKYFAKQIEDGTFEFDDEFLEYAKSLGCEF